MRFSSFRALLSITMLAASSVALAQTARDWPTQPVRIVVPFQAGSATDLITRQLGAGLSKEYGQTFVVENRPGAAAMIGSEGLDSRMLGVTATTATFSNASGS